MKLDVHRRLRRIESAQDMEYGKLVQKLLAIAFLEAGAERVAERSIQGIDLEVTLAEGRRVALEVKTAMGESRAISIGRKDLEGLAARDAEGFAPYLAVLGSGLLDDWIFARAVPGEIPAASCSPTRLRPYRDRDLEAVVVETFPRAVLRHAGAAIEGGQGALDRPLRAYPAFALA